MQRGNGRHPVYTATLLNKQVSVNHNITDNEDQRNPTGMSPYIKCHTGPDLMTAPGVCYGNFELRIHELLNRAKQMGGKKVIVAKNPKSF